MAWVKDWNDIGVGLGELRADVGEYIDELYEATQERIHVISNFASGTIPDLPLDSGASPSVDDWRDSELFASNTLHSFSLKSDNDGAPLEVTSNIKKMDVIQSRMDTFINPGPGFNGGDSHWLDLNFLGGVYEGQSVYPPYWTEASLLTDIGDSVRYIFPGAGALLGWGEHEEIPLDTWRGLRPWLKQQYELLNRMIHKLYAMGDGPKRGTPDATTRKRGRTLATHSTAALAIAAVELDYSGDPVIEIPLLDPTIPAFAIYAITRDFNVFGGIIDTYEVQLTLTVKDSAAYLIADTDWYIQAGEHAGTINVYDNNGDAGIPLVADNFEKAFSNVTTALFAPDTNAPTRTGAHNLPNQPAAPTVNFTTNTRGYQMFNSEIINGFPRGDNFIVAKWNFAKKL